MCIDPSPETGTDPSHFSINLSPNFMGWPENGPGFGRVNLNFLMGNHGRLPNMQICYTTASSGKGRMENGPKFEHVDSHVIRGHARLPNMQICYTTASSGKGRMENGPGFGRVNLNFLMGNHGRLPNMQICYTTASSGKGRMENGPKKLPVDSHVI
jgi:hypothetical protein